MWIRPKVALILANLAALAVAAGCADLPTERSQLPDQLTSLKEVAPIGSEVLDTRLDPDRDVEWLATRIRVPAE
jgi:hypothetical protein